MRVARTDTVGHKNYLLLAVPLIVSTLTTPLLGAVDTAVVGRLPDPAYLGAVAVGTLIFNTMYWLFGFLRVSTSGFAAQAMGEGDHAKGLLELVRPFGIAVLLGLIFIVLQKPILAGSLAVISPSEQVKELAASYFDIRIWGAPLTLMNYVLLGWLIGTGRVKWALLLQVKMNVANIVLDLLFVHVFHYGVAGVAAATLLAEGGALMFGLILVLRVTAPYLGTLRKSGVLSWHAVRGMMSVNGDLFIRTVCLLAVTNLFTAGGASYGTEVLAANAILLQIHYIMAYFYDGLANASSILAGKAVGSGSRGDFRSTVRLSFQWTAIATGLIVLTAYVLMDAGIALFTGHAKVEALARQYSGWLLLFPVAGGLGLVLYGIFTGATMTAPVRHSMLGALLIFLLARFWLAAPYGNDGLWIAYLAFSLARSLLLAPFIPRLIRSRFPML